MIWTGYRPWAGLDPEAFAILEKYAVRVRVERSGVVSRNLRLTKEIRNLLDAFLTCFDIEGTIHGIRYETGLGHDVLKCRPRALGRIVVTERSPATRFQDSIHLAHSRFQAACPVCLRERALLIHG